MMCATCHAHVDPAWIDRVGRADDGEDEMLDETVAPRDDTTRLSCRRELTDALDGAVVRLPEAQV
jgi:2Fe-2S ferredoxin